MTDKGAEEIRWWSEVWVPRMRERGWWDRPGILGPDDWDRPNYEVARQKEAAGQVLRVLRLTGRPDDFLDGQVVLEIGPGPLGMLEMSRAREKYAVDPLADEYRRAGLLLPGDHAVTYFAQGAERIPLESATVDVVIAFNSLDHVDDPESVAAEIHRVLRGGGTLLLNVELDHAPTPTEPHTMSEATIAALFAGYRRDHYAILDGARDGDPELTHGSRWLQAALVKP
jgi:SAM-dependent methyltransferase